MYLSDITVTNILSDYIPTTWRQKPTAVDMERNYVTVTLCEPVRILLLEIKRGIRIVAQSFSMPQGILKLNVLNVKQIDRTQKSNDRKTQSTQRCTVTLMFRRFTV